MIIVGYPGIGKSSLAGHSIYTNHGEIVCIDLESSNFNNTKGNKIKDWYKYYVELVIDLSSQGFIVFVSSHKDVIEELVKRETIGIYPHHTTIIIPNPDYKTAWVDKLQHRLTRTITKNIQEYEKNHRAYHHVKDYFDEDMIQLFDYCGKYNINMVQIDPYNYRLEDIVKDVYDKATRSPLNIEKTIDGLEKEKQSAKQVPRAPIADKKINWDFIE